MNQRRVELEVLSSQPGGLDVRTPGSPDLAPPGYYMLFVLDADGTPSEAGWVWLQPGAGGDEVVTTPVPDADRTAPRLRVRVLRPSSRQRRLAVRVSASEPATATLRPRVRGRRLSTRRLRLPTAGAARTLRLRLPKTAARALRRGRRVTLTLRVEARDAAGNQAARRVTKRLRARR